MFNKNQMTRFILFQNNVGCTKY